MALILKKLENEFTQYGERAKVNEAQASADKVLHDAGLATQRSTTEQRLEFVKTEGELRAATLMAEAEAILKKTERFAPEFTAALTHLADTEVTTKVSQALSAQMLFGGNDVADVLGIAGVSVGPGRNQFTAQP